MSNLILLLALMLPTILVVAVLFLYRALSRRDRRRSPLTFKVINQPGEGLRRQIAKHDDAIAEALTVVAMAGPTLFSAWLLVRIDRVVPDWSGIRFGWGDAFFALVLIVILAWATWKLIRHIRRRRRYREGLYAELAVAQRLYPLALHGVMAFHDFPADKFNIDHVVIGRGVVFCVETKSRKKPEAKVRESARVEYDGKRLAFPSHVETKPLEQAAHQAKWLQNFLSQAVGETVRVVPVLALPGWYIDDTKAPRRTDVIVTNAHAPNFMRSEGFGAAYGPEMRSRIAHVLMERYPGLADP
ncbi:nuclease-related domain-containing protein [Lysobacter sp. Root690]|uniref:nuclease-related domain-containing protein n=1 Tax=Lysobacter sp. Root690 TaxID=1736588 RepID=UPI000AA4A223|nr:nuclease-related domain-containing protein [Lysobacter sp. Root690]